MKLHLAGAAVASLLVSACSNIDISAEKLWPFGNKARERTQMPANAAGFRCQDNKRIYVRNLDDGAVWLIMPDREIRLDRAGDGNRYSNGGVSLDLGENTAAVKDGPVSYSGCKAVAAN